MSVDAVVFDIGNVLIEWDPEGFYDRTIGADKRHRLFAEVDLHSMNEQIDLGAPFAETVRKAAELQPEWSEEIMMWHDKWLEMLGPTIEPSVRLLRALRRRGIPVYALSNFGRESFQIAEANHPFLEEFDGRVISGQIGLIKPDPQIYQRIEEMASLGPEALLFTDDRPENIAAAEARGWQVHLFDGPKAWAARLVAEGLVDEDAAG